MKSPSSQQLAEVDVEKEREFFLKDIPAALDDWAVFHIFAKYGLVHNVRIPKNQSVGGSTKFGFVTMVSLNGADNVRKALIKRKLIVDEKTSIQVSDMRDRNAEPKSIVKKSESSRVLGANQSHNTGGRNSRRSPDTLKELHTTKPKYLFHDLPLRQEIRCKVVQSPYPPSLKEGFTFHVVREETPLPEEYTALQCSMNEYCHQTPPISAVKPPVNIDIGYCVLYGLNNVAYRGQRISQEWVYLMDTGVIVPFTLDQLWFMKPAFTRLPNLVATCSLSRIHWLEPTVHQFETIREVIFKWCQKEGGLVVKTDGYRGVCNLVELCGAGGTNLAESLSKKSYCELLPVPSNIMYSREEILQEKLKGGPIPEYLQKDENIKDILLTEMENMSVA